MSAGYNGELNLSDDIHAVIEASGISSVDPDVLNDRLRGHYVGEIAKQAAFIWANRDAVDNIKSLNLTRDANELIEDLRDFADRRFVDEDAEEAGMPRSFYHNLQMLLAGLEAVTGLPMILSQSFAVAYDQYWETTLATLKAVQYHRFNRADDD